MSNSNQPPLSFQALIHLYLELREKGLSLSAADLDIVKTWQSMGLNPEFVAYVMLDYAQECKKKSKPFPTSLVPIARKIRAVLIKSKEF